MVRFFAVNAVLYSMIRILSIDFGEGGKMGKYKKYKREKVHTKYYPAVTNMESLTEEEKELIHMITLEETLFERTMISNPHPLMNAMCYKDSTFRCLHCDFLFTVKGNYKHAQCPKCLRLVSTEVRKKQ